MTHPSYELDLRDLMDDYYGVGNWTNRTGVGVGSDIGPAIAAGKATLTATFGRGIIKIPPGLWLMNTSPGDLSGIFIKGAGSQASNIFYNKFSGAAFQWSGTGVNGLGASGIGITLEDGVGNSNAYGIRLVGNATDQADRMTFHDINITATGTSYWWDGFHATGVARISPQGVRVATLNNIQVFRCRNIGMYLANVVQWTLNNVGCYVGSGSYGNTIFITGGSTHVHGQGVNAALNISGTTNVRINGTQHS